VVPAARCCLRLRARRSDMPGQPPPGGYSGVFTDPNGHPWEVVYNPAWVLGEDGPSACADTRWPTLPEPCPAHAPRLLLRRPRPFW
jgi:hypothetical protein